MKNLVGLNYYIIQIIIKLTRKNPIYEPNLRGKMKKKYSSFIIIERKKNESKFHFTHHCPIFNFPIK